MHLRFYFINIDLHPICFFIAADVILNSLPVEVIVYSSFTYGIIHPLGMIIYRIPTQSS